jgi:hypothetical protein
MPVGNDYSLLDRVVKSYLFNKGWWLCLYSRLMLLEINLQVILRVRAQLSIGLGGHFKGSRLLAVGRGDNI